MAAAGSVFHFLNSIANAFCVREFDKLLEILKAFDLKSPAKELLRTLLRVVDILVWTVASVPSLCLGLLDHVHAKISEERRNFLQVRVLISHVCKLDYPDLLALVDVVRLTPRLLTLAFRADGDVVWNRGASVGRRSPTLLDVTLGVC